MHQNRRAVVGHAESRANFIASAIFIASKKGKQTSGSYKHHGLHQYTPAPCYTSVESFFVILFRLSSSFFERRRHSLRNWSPRRCETYNVLHSVAKQQSPFLGHDVWPWRVHHIFQLLRVCPSFEREIESQRKGLFLKKDTNSHHCFYGLSF